jgi:hypothetical protein
MLTPHLRRVRRDLAANDDLSPEQRSLLRELESLDQAITPGMLEPISQQVMRTGQLVTERCPFCGR